MRTDNFATYSPSPTPLLLRNATPRLSHQAIPGSYDETMAVWAIGGGHARQPIVEAGDLDLLEISTKTKVEQEADDESLPRLSHASRPMSHELPELLTKTDIQQESDDEISASTALTEIETKTRIQQERDDDGESPMNLLLELETKTEAEIEHDDQTRPVL